uniref:Uncharacterized protein n=1 Tax=Micrurus paraensis TaxID=1970185 RepID=A0A2D4L3S5_9SAUR
MGCRGNQCTSVSLAEGTSLCLPSTTPHPCSHQKDITTEGRYSPRSAILAQEAMVHGLSQSISGMPMEDSPPRQDLSQPGANTTPRSAVSSIGRLALERRLLKGTNLSSQVTTPFRWTDDH